MTDVIRCPLIFLLYLFSKCIAISIIDKIEFNHSNNSNLKRFVHYYNNHSFILHNDDFAAINVDELVDMLPTYRMIGKNDTSIKPVAKEAVNIFFIQNVSEVKSTDTLRVFNEDGCNLFLANEASQEICSLESVKLAPASFIFDIRKDQLFSCFTENEEFNLTPVAENKLNYLEIYHRSFGDMGGKTLKIYILNNQATLCRAFINGFVDLVESGTCNPTGAEADLVRTLGKKFNFIPEFWVFEYEKKLTMWNEVVAAVGRKEAEFAIGSIIIAEDGVVYYTTFTQSSTEYVVLYVNPTKELNLGKILISFDLIVYAISLSSLILIIILTIIFTHLFNYGFENGRFIFILMKMVIEQGSNLSNGLYSFITMKLVLFLWLYFTIIFCTVLKSQIASILIKPETYDCRSVEDLQRNDFVFLIPDKDRTRFNSKYGWMTLKTEEVVESKHYNDQADICPQTSYFFDYRYAVVHSEFDLLVGIKMCMKYLPQHKVNDLRMFSDTNIYHAMAMNPISPYKKQFTINIDRLKSSGIMSYWYDYLSKDLLRKLNKEHTPPKPFELKQVHNFFILLLVGLGIGFAVLILEIIEAALIRKYNISLTILNKL